MRYSYLLSGFNSLSCLHLLLNQPPSQYRECLRTVVSNRPSVRITAARTKRTQPAVLVRQLWNLQSELAQVARALLSPKPASLVGAIWKCRYYVFRRCVEDYYDIQVANPGDKWNASDRYWRSTVTGTSTIQGPRYLCTTVTVSDCNGSVLAQDLSYESYLYCLTNMWHGTYQTPCKTNLLQSPTSPHYPFVSLYLQRRIKWLPPINFL